MPDELDVDLHGSCLPGTCMIRKLGGVQNQWTIELRALGSQRHVLCSGIKLPVDHLRREEEVWQ